MKISTKGKYGLIAMVDLAINYFIGERVNIKKISEKYNISERYLEQIFSILKKSNLVISVKGPQGGYVLSKPPKEITIGEILKILEGDIFEKCYESKELTLIEECLEKNLWTELDLAIKKVLEEKTLETVANEYISLQNSSNSMYYI